MMKGGKEEDKVKIPMFPRLHINDSEKGGPRAPPRNKMALYEQLSIPSQRFNSAASASSSSSPHPLHKPVAALAFSSPCLGFGLERSTFPSRHLNGTHSPSPAVEKSHSFSHNGNDPLANRDDVDRDTTRLNATSVAGYSKIIEDGNDILVPTFIRMRTKLAEGSKKDISYMKKKVLSPSELEKTRPSIHSSPPHLSNSCNESNGKYNSSVLKSSTNGRNLSSPPKPKETSMITPNRFSGYVNFPNASSGNPVVENTDNNGAGSTEKCHKDKYDDILDMPLVYSISHPEISPDAVAEIIGQKQFWKARRLLMNQQKAFASQVFDLHRLIKVQKLIAASPDVLLGSNCFIEHKLPPNNALVENSQLRSYHPDPNPNPQAECPVDNSVEPDDQLCGSFLGPTASESRPNGGRCFHPFSNQWLIPVMSPSEGLIYKPYNGLSPPPGSLLAPLYGSYASLGVPQVARDFTGQHCGGALPSFQQQDTGVYSTPVAQNYFRQPYPTPVMNPDATAPEAPWPRVHAEQSSSNLPNPKSDATFSRRRKLKAARGRDTQGSSGSSPCEKNPNPNPHGGDTQVLFPVASGSGPVTAELSNAASQGSNPSRVIKVVPHNSRHASASAARIFRSIQEGRQHQQ